MGTKRYNIMHNVGRTRYLISYHDGKSTHKDGSDFFGIYTFGNKKELAKKEKELLADGYVYANRYAYGGSTSGLASVDVKFENPKYNYSTNVSGSTTEEDARKYFVGKRFDVGVYPKEDMQKCIDIVFHPKGSFKNGGKTVRKGDVIFENTFGVDDSDFESAINAYYDSGSLAQIERAIGRRTLSRLQEKWGAEKNEVVMEYVAQKWAEDGIFKKGGKIPNNYEGKTAEEVWSEWEKAQREHFLSDHYHQIIAAEKHYYNIGNIDSRDINNHGIYEYIKTSYPYFNLPQSIKDAIHDHLQKGQYKHGGKLGDKIKINGRTCVITSVTDDEICYRGYGLYCGCKGKIKK